VRICGAVATGVVDFCVFGILGEEGVGVIDF